VQDALPQQASVLGPGRTYNALFLHKIEASTKISWYLFKKMRHG